MVLILYFLELCKFWKHTLASVIRGGEGGQAGGHWGLGIVGAVYFKKNYITDFGGGLWKLCSPTP